MSATASLAPVPEIVPRRLAPRNKIDVALDVITLRSGIPDSVPGRCIDISEGGIGAVVAGELSLNQHVAIELKLPQVALPVRARAVVRHHARLRCGLQFLNLSVEQREMIRFWMRRNGALPLEQAQVVPQSPPTATVPQSIKALKAGRALRFRKRSLLALLVFVLALAALGWWYWQGAWRELEKPSAAFHTSFGAVVGLSYGNLSASTKVKPRWSLGETTASPSSCQSMCS